MDFSCFSWVQCVKKSDLPANAKYLALYISTFMNLEHDVAWPSMKRISHETGLGVNTCRKWLDYLNNQGWLVKSRNSRAVSSAGGVQLHNEYTVSFPEKVIRGVIDLPPLDKGGHLLTKGGSSVDLKGGQQMTPNNNKNNNRSNNKHNSQNFSDEKIQTHNCPLKKIVSLYHQTLPTLPKVQKLTETRAGYIRARWREDLTDLEQWENFFNFVKQSDFLMGRTENRNGRRPFIADLEWLVRPSNFAKIAEDRYHG